MVTVGFAIPAYGASGQGAVLLDRALQSLSDQTRLPDQIAISVERTSLDTLEPVLRKWDLGHTSLTLNDGRPGIGGNSNSAIRSLTTDLICVLHQDDYLDSSSHVDRLVNLCRASVANWWVMGSRHVSLDASGSIAGDGNDVDWPRPLGVSRLRKRLWLGLNDLGSPSCMVFRSRPILRFRDDLTLLVDVEIYYRWLMKYGLPVRLPASIAVGTWAGQTQHEFSRWGHLVELARWHAAFSRPKGPPSPRDSLCR